MPSDLNPIEAVDIHIARKVAPIEEHRLGHLLGTLGALGDQPPMIGVSLSVAASGVWRRDSYQVATGIRMLAALALATGLKTLVKQRIDRSRPQLLIEHGHYEAHPGDNEDHAIKSFPSGHTAGMIAIAAAAARAYPERRSLALLPATLFSLLQIPRRAHFLSDVIAGAVIGLAAERLVAGIRPVRRRRGRTAISSTGTKRDPRPYW